MPFGLYDAQGRIRLTVVPGTARTGIYAADGSWNIVLASPYYGIYHPCGAFNANAVTILNNYYAAAGQMNVWYDGVNYHPVSSTGIAGVVVPVNPVTSQSLRADTTLVTADITGLRVDRTIKVDTLHITTDQSALSADYAR